VPWPTYDEAALVENEIEVVFQVNGKVRGKANVARDTSREELEKVALADHDVQHFIDGKTVRKVIAIPNKLVNIVAN
jgi:leucyl-tRNA synthetase